MRLKLVCWDNFTPSPGIIHLFSSDNSFFFALWQADIFIVTIFNPSGLCPLKGNKVPSPCVLCDHTTGGQCPKNSCCMRSQSHERLWPPLLKLKSGNGWWTSNCCDSSCKKFNSGFQFQFQFQGFQFQFHFNSTNSNSNSRIGIGIELQLQFRNWIDPNPACCYFNHYSDVMMGTIASQITSLTIVLLNQLFRRRSKKTSKLRVTGLCAGNSPATGEFPAQMASNAENVSISWRHHGSPRFVEFYTRYGQLYLKFYRKHHMTDGKLLLAEKAYPERSYQYCLLYMNK